MFYIAFLFILIDFSVLFINEEFLIGFSLSFLFLVLYFLYGASLNNLTLNFIKFNNSFFSKLSLIVFLLTSNLYFLLLNQKNTFSSIISYPKEIFLGSMPAYTLSGFSIIASFSNVVESFLFNSLFYFILLKNLYIFLSVEKALSSTIKG